MPSATATLRLLVGPAEALEACRQAMSDEVWELESGGGDRLFAREWPWRISCQTRPASIEVRAAPTDTGATELRLDASVRGFGPVPARHLANHLRGLELRISRQAAAESIRRIEA